MCPTGAACRQLYALNETQITWMKTDCFIRHAQTVCGHGKPDVTGSNTDERRQELEIRKLFICKINRNIAAAQGQANTWRYYGIYLMFALYTSCQTKSGTRSVTCFVMGREIFAIYCDNNTKNMYTFLGQTQLFLLLKAGGIYSTYRALKVKEYVQKLRQGFRACMDVRHSHILVKLCNTPYGKKSRRGVLRRIFVPTK